MSKNEVAHDVLSQTINQSEPLLHPVLGHAIYPPFAAKYSKAMFGMGCFWGAEKKFWELDGVYVTAVGYAAGHSEQPTYKTVCGGQTGHNEVVLVVFDEKKISYLQLLKCFWESHNPTQGMRQGNDVGTQYRSGIYVFDDEQMKTARQSCDTFQNVITQHLQLLAKKNNTHAQEEIDSVKITTEIISAPEFYYAENYHQQYLAKNINGYCGLGGTGLFFP